jgi:hypothetical protein
MFEDFTVNIDIEKKTMEVLAEQRFNHMELFRLIESFAQKLTASRKNESIRLRNEDTNATIDMDILWKEKNKEVSIAIVGVHLNQADTAGLGRHSKEARFDFSQRHPDAV